MNRILIYLSAALLILSSCAKDPTVGSNDYAKTHFDAWVKVNYPNAVATPLGAYLISETPGTGTLASSSEEGKYVVVDITVKNLKGEITNTNDENIAKQLGTYSESKNYLPIVWDRTNNNLYAGVDEAISTMKVGGKKIVAIPGWLFTTKRYDTAKEYLDNVDFTANAIYDIRLREVVQDIVKWEIDSIANYIGSKYKMAASDSLKKFGFYYVQEKEPTDTNSFKQDSTIYINYTGRLLNGKVFDTTIADTAKFYGVYNSERTYEPTAITWDKDDYTKITMGSSTPIAGFSYMLSKMRHFEKGVGIFYSGLGYGTKGSGDNIPAYSPLIFEIEIVEKAE